MKALLVIVLLLAGCATPGYDPWAPEARRQSTAPGAELPAFLDRCIEANPQGLCTKWSTGSGKFRPYDTPPAASTAKP